VNWLLGSNYMYIAYRPMVDNPFLIGPWPWYILGAELAAFANFALAYVPWIWIDRRTAALRNPDNS